MNATSNNIIIDEYDKSLGYHPSVPPLDISLGLTSSYTTSVLRWGILGCSKVAHDFTQALKFLSSNGLPHQVVAVGSRSLGRASTFAELHNIKQKHGSYEELCNNPNVDIIYVASLHPYHKDHAELALNCNKHVLIEKPITMRSEDAQYIYDLGKKLHKFVGEGMWTRFFPAVEWARKHLGEEEVVVEEVEEDAENEGIRVTSNNIQRIGQVRVVQADFSIDGNDVGPYPSDSLFAKDLGGGASWCVLPYIVAASTLPFDTNPERIAANGILPNDTDEAGDLAMGMTMTFNNNTKNQDGSKCPPKDKSIASGVCSYLAESSEHTRYAAKRGRITIGSPAHCPTSCAIVRKLAGRGNGATSDATTDTNPETCYIFPLPSSTWEIESSGGFKMPNSLGFIYEAEATRRLISAGELTFPQWTPDESVGCIRIIEEMIRQVKT